MVNSAALAVAEVLARSAHPLNTLRTLLNSNGDWQQLQSALYALQREEPEAFKSDTALCRLLRNVEAHERGGNA